MRVLAPCCSQLVNPNCIIISEDPENAISVKDDGLFASGGVGPIGPEGPEGPASVPYQHVQNSALAVWTIPHNLGHRPVVNVSTVGGALLFAEVLHLSANTLQILFDDAYSGFAVLI